MLKVLLRHLEHIVGVGEEHISSLLVFGHILILALLESFQFIVIVAFNPTCFVEADGFSLALGIVFIFQTILDNLELQLPYRSDDFAVVKLVHE